jgi:hypothetical protein
MKEKNKIILSAWNRLAKIQQLVCHAKSTKLNRSGKAEVSITKLRTGAARGDIYK